jgi:hypothetical protein
VRDVPEGSPRPVTPEGTAEAVLSRDGRTIVARDLKSDQWFLYPVDGGEPRPLAHLRNDEQVTDFDEGGQNVYVLSGDSDLKMRIDRLNLASGKRSFFREITPADLTGVGAISSLQLTPDGRSYCYSFMRSLSRLYVIEGLR